MTTASSSTSATTMASSTTITPWMSPWVSPAVPPPPVPPPPLPTQRPTVRQTKKRPTVPTARIAAVTATATNTTAATNTSTTTLTTTKAKATNTTNAIATNMKNTTYVKTISGPYSITDWMQSVLYWTQLRDIRLQLPQKHAVLVPLVNPTIAPLPSALLTQPLQIVNGSSDRSGAACTPRTQPGRRQKQQPLEQQSPQPEQRRPPPKAPSQTKQLLFLQPRPPPLSSSWPMGQAVPTASIPMAWFPYDAHQIAVAFCSTATPPVAAPAPAAADAATWTTEAAPGDEWTEKVVASIVEPLSKLLRRQNVSNGATTTTTTRRTRTMDGTPVVAAEAAVAVLPSNSIPVVPCITNNKLDVAPVALAGTTATGTGATNSTGTTSLTKKDFTTANKTLGLVQQQAATATLPSFESHKEIEQNYQTPERKRKQQHRPNILLPKRTKQAAAQASATAVPRRPCQPQNDILTQCSSSNDNPDASFTNPWLESSSESASESLQDDDSDSESSYASSIATINTADIRSRAASSRARGRRAGGTTAAVTTNNQDDESTTRIPWHDLMIPAPEAAPLAMAASHLAVAPTVGPPPPPPPTAQEAIGTEAVAAAPTVAAFAATTTAIVSSQAADDKTTTQQQLHEHQFQHPK